MATIIDGKAIAAKIRGEIAEEVKKLAAKGIQPGLAVVLVGEDPASKVYVRMKEKACQDVGRRGSRSKNCRRHPLWACKLEVDEEPDGAVRGPSGLPPARDLRHVDAGAALGAGRQPQEPGLAAEVGFRPPEFAIALLTVARTEVQLFNHQWLSRFLGGIHDSNS